MHDIEVEEGVDFEKYMIMMGLPTCVLIAGFGMWLFVTINKIDLSSIKNGNLLEKILLIKESHLKLNLIKIMIIYLNSILNSMN